MKQRTPEFFTDSEGQHCVRVPLTNHPRPAIVHLSNLENLLNAGLRLCWSLDLNRPTGQGYVRVSSGRRKLAIARLIAGAGRRQQVEYRDGNRLNLRRENLVLRVGGTARVEAMSYLAKAA